MGRDFFYRTTIDIEKIRIGSDYGGWWISANTMSNDRGLLVFSFGLGEDISFDLGLIEQFDCRVFGFDPTPKSINYVNSMDLTEEFTLCEYGISDFDGEVSFNLPANDGYVSGSLEDINSSNNIIVYCKKIDTILKELNITNIDILKMDIEGSEYKVIKDMMSLCIYPAQILVEFHHFFDSFNNSDTVSSIELLLGNGYELFAVDGYNYSFMRL